MHITVVGDSWGYFWDAQGCQHAGVTQWLTDQGHTVLNLAQPGKSNWDSVTALINSHTATHCVLFIQTEPVREWLTGVVGTDHSGQPRPLMDAAALCRGAVQHHGIAAFLQHHLVDTVYAALAQWQLSHAVPVLLIGGCSAVDPSAVPPPLTCAVPSWPLLLLGMDRYQESMFIDTAQWLSWEYADLVHESCNIDLITEWYAITKTVMAKQGAWFSDSEYFAPDKWHPNNLGHQRLAEFLAPQLAHIDSTVQSLAKQRSMLLP